MVRKAKKILGAELPKQRAPNNALVSDGRDYFQALTESQVRLARPVRVILGVLLILAAVGFIFLGAVLLPHRLQLANPPNTIGALLFGAFLVTLGLGFGFVGTRLMRMKNHSEHLMSSRAALVTSYGIASLGVLVIVSSFFMGFAFAPSGLFALLMAYWFYVASKRIKEKSNDC
jgi:hypothetical protein